DESLASYHRALIFKDKLDDPFLKDLGWHLIELERIPIIYKTEAEIDEVREHFTKVLRRALELVSQRDLDKDETALFRRLIFRLTNFYLAYQQKNDCELQTLFSEVASRVLAYDIESFRRVDKVPHSDSVIRVGVASEFLRYHNGSFWAYDWFSKFPQEDYQFFAYSLNGLTDQLTKAWSELGTYRWLPFREADYQQSLKVIQDDRLDVLLLPDVGMSGSSRVVTLTRLAPIQCVSWGHPMTTGSDTIDYYLGCELMETEDSDQQYSEKLVRLPNLGLYFNEPLTAPPATRADFELPKTKVLYGSVQSLFKYLPQYDRIYVEIAKRVPNALFVFGGNKSQIVTDAFSSRIEKAFEAEGLSFRKHVKILPRMDLPTFVQLLGVLDVNLDSIGWSGGITTMRSIAAELPLVTLPTETMRGRHSYAMLKMIGLDELITESVEDYIDLAVRMGTDKKYRQTLVKKIGENKHKLFHDQACIDALDQFFKSEVAKFRI
ncbi:MAG: hypothetical protein K2Z81_15505, partial [Cyanobacteria bacterium]|nr:hypothetical protein [Cyanobacteriota bacterium]